MKAIMYHYVQPTEPELPYFRHLDLEDFKKQLVHFSRHYGFCSKVDFLRSIETGVPTTGVVLTFDDGLRDHYRYVLPYLQEAGLWGIFYVPTGPYHTGRLLDVHRVHVLLGKYGGRVIYDALRDILIEEMLSHAHVQEFCTLTYRNQNNDYYTNLVKRILNYYISYAYREQVIGELMRHFVGDEENLVGQFYMRTEEVRQLQAAGMMIGSHAVNHLLMSKLTMQEQEKEIRDSFGLLDHITGGLSQRTFCYPYGGSYSFTAETEQLLANNGCLFSFNVDPRDIGQSDLRNRLQALPRYDCNQFPNGLVRTNEGMRSHAKGAAPDPPTQDDLSGNRQVAFGDRLEPRPLIN